MELLGLHLARPWYVRLRLLMWWNYPNTNSTRFVSVEFVKMQGTNNPPDPISCGGIRSANQSNAAGRGRTETAKGNIKETAVMRAMRAIAIG